MEASPRPDDIVTVVDFGAHLYPESTFPHEVYDDNPLAERLGESLSDPGVLLERYATAGIDAAVLSQPYYMGHGDVRRTAEANDALLEIVEAHETFYGLAAVPVAAGGRVAAEELERCIEAGYHGGAIETKSSGVEVGDDELEQIFETAARLGAPLLVHPKLDATLHPDALDDTYVLNAIFGREVGLAASICRAIHTGVFDRHPDLKLVFHHYGGNLASMLGRIHLQLDADRWPGRQSHVKSYTEFEAQLEDHVHVDTSGFFGYGEPLEASLRELPSSNVLFGTDYPFEGRDADELAAYVDTVVRATSRTDARHVLGENALGLLAPSP